jgi:hypothetical protein
MNRFLYAHANPATLIDPTGHAACMRFIDGVCQGYHSQVKRGTSTLKDVQHRLRAKANARAESRYEQRRGVGRTTVKPSKVAFDRWVQVRPWKSKEAQFAWEDALGEYERAVAAHEQEVRDLQFQQDVTNVAIGVELAITAALVFSPLIGDEVAGAGITARTMAAAQNLRERITSLRSGTGLPTQPIRPSSIPGLPRAGWQSGYWTRAEFGGSRVYLRNDLIDPALVRLGKTNLEWMQRGNAPFGPDGERIILHHSLQTMDSPIVELSSTMNSTWFRPIHINFPTRQYPSGIDRGAFDAWKKDYWRWRATEWGG